MVRLTMADMTQSDQRDTDTSSDMDKTKDNVRLYASRFMRCVHCIVNEVEKLNF